MSDDLTILDPKLASDLRAAAQMLSHREASFLVDFYYLMQKDRISAGNQVTAMQKFGEPIAVLDELSKTFRRREAEIRTILGHYGMRTELGRWSRGIIGIGPVLNAGLLAHIDLKQAPTVGHIWNYAGLNPERKWEKKTKRPWNAALKTICWKIGESFVKTCNHKDSFYGPLYIERKAKETECNESGELADQAAKILTVKKFNKSTEAYKAYAGGKLPPAHIHARAKRWVVKLYLSHFHYVGMVTELAVEPPAPYALTLTGHAHLIKPPGFES